MTAAGTPEPRITRVRIVSSENGAVPVRSFHSLSGADAALASAFEREPPPEGGYDTIGFEVRWSDGEKHEGRADVRRIDLHTAPEVGGILRQHLNYVARWLRDQSATSPLWTPEEAADRRAWGEELLRRLEREPTFGTIGAHRNAGVVPVARVSILWSTIEALAPRAYRSLEAAEAAIVAAARAPRPIAASDRDQVLFRIVWVDGHSHDEGVTFPRGTVPPTVLRTALRQVARISRDVYGASPKLTETERAQRRAWGNDMLARLDAESASSTRNLEGIPEDQLLPLGTTSEHLDHLTLLPDPIAAVAELEAHFAAVRPPVAVWMGHGRSVPRTTNEDVTYAANRISLSLAHDMAKLRERTGRPHGAIWDQWARTIEHVRRHLGTDPDATYRDNQRYWSAQVPQLAHQIAAALHGGEPRNAGADEWTQYRVTSRRPDGSLGTTYHTARDDLDAIQRAAFYLGYQPQIVSLDAQYTEGRWSPATMTDGSRGSIGPSRATTPL